MQLFTVLLVCVTGNIAALNTNELGHGLGNFIGKYFVDHPFLVVYNASQQEIHEAMITLTRINHLKILVNLDKQHGITDDDLVGIIRNYIFVANDLTELTLLLNTLSKTDIWNPRRKHLLVLTSNYSDDDITEASFRILWKYRAFNTVLCLYNNSSFSTWYPYDKESDCGDKVIPKKFSLSSDHSFDPYLNKIPKKLNGCPVKLVWTKAIISKVVMTNPYGKDNPGTLPLMFRVISEIMNITLVYAKTGPWLMDELTKGKNLTKVAEILTRENIDVIARLYIPSIHPPITKKLTTSRYVMYFESFWLLPFPGPLPIWGSLVHTFKIREYVLLLLAYLLAGLLWNSAKFNRMEGVYNSLWSITLLLFQQTVRTAITKTRLVLLILMMWLTFNVSNIYNSQLVSLLNRPVFPTKPKTLSNLVDLNYNFAYTNTYDMFLRSTDSELANTLERRRIFNLWIDTEDALRMWLNNLTYAVRIAGFLLASVENAEELEILQKKVR